MNHNYSTSFTVDQSPEEVFAAINNVRKMTMSRQAVTKHLLLMEEANLVTIVWQGREKLHYLNPVPIGEIYQRWNW